MVIENVKLILLLRKTGYIFRVLVAMKELINLFWYFKS